MSRSLSREVCFCFASTARTGAAPKAHHRSRRLLQVMRPTTSIGLHMPATSTDRTGCGIQVHGAAVLLRTPHSPVELCTTVPYEYESSTVYQKVCRSARRAESFASTPGASRFNPPWPTKVAGGAPSALACPPRPAATPQARASPAAARHLTTRLQGVRLLWSPVQKAADQAMRSRSL